MLILLVAFGSVVAMGLPIGTALVGLLVGLSGVTLVGALVDIPTVAPLLAVMIGIGVGIDYALFVVTRFRQSLADELPSRRRPAAPPPPPASRWSSPAAPWSSLSSACG